MADPRQGACPLKGTAMPKRQSAVVFIHGLAKKPQPDKLQEIWNWALGRGNPMPDVFAAPNNGIALGAAGVPHRMSYYADVFYGEDFETDLDSYYESGSEQDLLAAEGLTAQDALPAPDATTPREQAFLIQFEAKLQAGLAKIPSQPPAAGTAAPPAGAEGLEIASWLPAPVKQAIIKKAAMEAFYYLFDKEFVRADGARFQVRQDLRARLLKDLQAAAAQAEKTVVVAHSMGTMVAYDVLRNCPECPPVDTLITIGSPLGVQEVQDELHAVGKKQVDFPAATLRQWINIYDPLDPVCGADPKFANDYEPVDGKTVIDVCESNWGSWRHTVTHYLAGTQFRSRLAQALGIAQP
jgi:hypothetical protein